MSARPPKHMASSSQAPFTTRPFGTSQNKLPDRSAVSAFGASHRESTRQGGSKGGQGRGGQATQEAELAPVERLTDDQRDEVNEAFALFDLDKDDWIDYHEFKVALKALGFDLPKQDLSEYLSQYGTASNSSAASKLPNPPVTKLLLDRDSFATIAATLIDARDPRDEVRRAFRLFDTDGKGIIQIDDLRRVATELGEGLDEEELNAMIDEFDLEGKGGVGEEEFIAIVLGT